MKKLFLIIGCLILITAALTGCVNRKPGATPSPTMPGISPSPGVTTPIFPASPGLTNGMESPGGTGPMDTSGLVTSIEAISEVKSCVIAHDDTNCAVGVELENGTNLSDVKNEIMQQVQTFNADFDNIGITDDPALYDEIEEASEGTNGGAGTDISSIIEKIKN